MLDGHIRSRGEEWMNRRRIAGHARQSYQTERAREHAVWMKNASMKKKTTVAAPAATVR